MASLTAAQTSKVVAQLRADGLALLSRVQSERDAARGSYIQAGLSIFGADSSSQLDAQVGAVRIVLNSVDRLDRLAQAGLDEAGSDSWSAAAREAAKSLEAISGYSGEATLNWVVQQTARQTGEDVKAGVNAVASAALGFAWSAIPWWALVGCAAIAAWRLGFLRRTT